MATFVHPEVATPGGPRPGVSARILGLTKAYVGAWHLEARLTLRVALWMCGAAAALLGKPRVFTSLGPPQRLRYVERWERSRLYPVRPAFLLLKTLCTIVYYSDPDEARAVGYVSPGGRTPS